MKITKVVFYVRDIPKVAEFYCRHFGFTAQYNAESGKAILTPAKEGCRLVLLQASKGHRAGQSIVKLVFDVADVAAMKKKQAARGLLSGPIQKGPNYQFANARDPAKNLISISDAYLVGE